jgi:deoxycytidylate deaminase
MDKDFTEKLKLKSKDIFDSDYKFAHIAEEMAENSPMMMRHGCVAVRNGRVISKGYNNYRTRIKSIPCSGCSCHAEIDALRNIRQCFKEAEGNTRERDKVIYC